MSVTPGFFPNRLVVAVTVMVFLLGAAFAQRQRAAADEDAPLFGEFKGVKIGMPAEEARKKLGSPKDKSDELDLYIFNDSQALQIYYDKAKTVSAISVDFMDGGADAPPAKSVIGLEPDPRPDGSTYKMVRYPKAGYWVSYSKTAGSSPTITITIQRIEH